MLETIMSSLENLAPITAIAVAQNSVVAQITSLELLIQINFFRSQTEDKASLAHSDLLKIIRDEFEEEMAEGKISCSAYKDNSGKSNILYILTLTQAKQVLVRESKIVRKAVIAYIDILESKLKLKLPSYSESLRQLANQLEKNELQQKEIIKLENNFADANQQSIKNLTLRATQTKTGTKALKEDIGAEINIYVNKLYGFEYGFREMHLVARKEYNSQADCSSFYLGAKNTSLETKNLYLLWLQNKYKSQLI
jgi:hypothetical protein